MWIRKKFLLTTDYTLRLVQCINNKSFFTVERHPQNCDRDLEANVLAKKESVKKFSIRLEWRSPPWLALSPDMSVSDRFLLALHWGSLISGTKLAWEEDVAQANVMVQMAVSMDIPHCHLYKRELTRDAAKFLVQWGNATNEEAVSITHLSVWRATADIDATFSKHRAGISGKTQSQIDDEKLVMANLMVKGYKWSKYPQYERCSSFFP